MYSSKHSPWTAPVLAAILIAGVGAAPVAAAEDPGVPSRSGRSLGSYHCLLTRVGEQFVRCDNLTGAGVPAPRWIAEQN